MLIRLIAFCDAMLCRGRFRAKLVVNRNREGPPGSGGIERGRHSLGIKTQSAARSNANSVPSEWYYAALSALRSSASHNATTGRISLRYGKTPTPTSRFCTSQGGVSPGCIDG